MKPFTFIALSALSLSVSAQSTFITEIQENDTWVRAQYESISTDSDLLRHSDSAKGSDDDDLTAVGFTMLKTLGSSESFTPGVQVSAFTVDNDGTDVSFLEIGAVARLDLAGLPSSLYTSYVGSSKSEYRDSVDFELSVGSGPKENGFYNEFSIDYRSFIEAKDVTGANSFAIGNTSSFKMAKNLDILTHVSATFRSDAEIDGEKVIEYGNELTFGIGASAHVNTLSTIQLMLTRSNVKNDIYTDGDIIESDDDETSIIVSVLGRF